MLKRIGILCLVLGVLCMMGAAGFIGYNRWENKTAEQSAQKLLKDVRSILEETQPEQPTPNDSDMAVVQVDGYDCIGILSVPVLDLDLPVLADWSYAKLKKAPCHYYGSYYEKDFVIAAHNYRAHFGKLSELQTGDLVIFTDATGTARTYEVMLVETLPQNATKAMITSGFDLSLYTCTLGGGSRVTVRCNATDHRMNNR